MFSGNGVASAMPFLHFVGRSAWQREVFPQGHRKCQSVVLYIPLTYLGREHTPPLPYRLRQSVSIRPNQDTFALADKPVNVFCLFFLLYNFFIQLQQLFPQLFLLLFVIIREHLKSAVR